MLKNAKIETTNIYFDNLNLKQPTKTILKQISLQVSNISSDKQNPIEYKLSSKLNKNSSIKISGNVIQKPLSITSKIRLEDIEVTDFKNYLFPYINADIKKASINLDAKLYAKLDEKPNIKVQATTSINNLVINSSDNQKLLRWKKLLISGIKFKDTPMQISIKSIKLNKPYIRAHIAKNHSTNFTNLIKKQKDKKKNVASKKTIKLKIGPIKLIDGTTDFSDASLPFPFHTLIHDLNGDISTLDFSSTTPSKIKLDGKIDKYGYADIKGILLPFRIKQKADINVLLKNLNLTSLTPYSGKFLGYKIKSGKLSMDLNYKISKSSLIGKNKINIDTLDLGKTVKSKDAVNLPLKLALALLKDSNGQIDIDLPVTGDMNNPNFSYGGIVWKALKLLYVKKFTNIKYKKLKQTFMIVSKVDDNKTKKGKKVKPKAKLNLIAFNSKMRDNLTKAIKIPNTRLIALANKRANSIKSVLIKKYKINEKRLKILPSKATKAKRDRWVMCELKISI